MNGAGSGDSGLPVEESIAAIRAALAGDARAAVLQAPPGAGKTTVVPLRLLDEEWLAGAKIVMLEPRRLATRAAARRMAATLGDDVGATVGYVTRDDRRVGAATRIEVVTEGILTRRLQRDPALGGTGLVIFDEFHERNLNADLGLALALDARRSIRPDLRVLVMSATLDSERVATLVGPDTPVVTSEGRQHPIDIRWRPSPGRVRVEAATDDAVRRALREEHGDVLVFLPGAAEIRRTAELLAGAALPGDVDVRPLYGGLPVDEQDAAIAPSPAGRRKVVLSTDIAETSLTVEGVRVVVDAGLARVPRFDARTGLTRLQTVSASKASVDQRAGRAGRTEPGVVFRLWSKLEQAARRPYSDPEITQVDLAGFALELAAWGVRDVADLPLLDPPPPRTLAEGRELLRELGAVDAEGRITDDGRTIAELPLHPRLARMVLVSATREREAWEACLVAALLEDRDVLRGHPDELPVDIVDRLVMLVDPGRRHPRLDGRALRSARDRAHDIARRAGVTPGDVDLSAAGRVLALAYPDRIAAQPAGGRGRFTLRSGSAA
ncbi:MAG TPA: ATP-dependent helicase HrpB, partial [Acidimicrobiales bacterium]|nr:ATP-dependent helicase HrpB [Acidimicrobiales bacterium]